MPAIGGLFVVFLLGQVLLAVLAFRLARRREDAAMALSILVFAGGVIAVFAVGTMIEVVAVELLCLGLYAFIAKPTASARRPSRR